MATELKIGQSVWQQNAQAPMVQFIGIVCIEGDALTVQLDTIKTQTVEEVLMRTKPASALYLQDKYLKWQEEYESV